MPEPDDGSTVGWYPSAPAGPPTAGPFAAPARPPRRGLGRLSLAGAASRPAGLGHGRSRLVNVLLFGFGPVLLAGIIVATFVLVSPGKGSAASQVGFQAGPAASTASPAPSASPSLSAPPSSTPAHAKKHARATPSPVVAKVPTIVVPKAKTTPKPARKSGGGGVVPHNLGPPNFAGYCQHIGDRTAQLTANNAYGWHCTLNTGRVLAATSVCAWTYHLAASQVISVSTNYNDPNAWQCWRINRDLGVLDFTTYCVGAGLGTSELVAENAYGWDCTSPLAAVNTTAACDAVYHVGDAVSRFAVFADPYSWQCWN